MAIVASTSSRSWAEFTDEALLDVDTQLSDDQNTELSGVQPTSDEPSIGSVQHRSGRCKPCAFFHTKGCQNDKACLFCHLCPPGEKARRKRLRERMCEKLGHPVDRSFKSGHLRQASGASTSTQSTCSGWSRFSHSRQSSGSSVAQDVGVVAMQMNGNAHMQQMMPVFHFPHPMVQPPQPQAHPAEDLAGAASKEVSMPIALAQAVPFPEQESSSGWTTPEMAGQMGPPSAMPPWNGQGLVQYAVVAVPVGMNIQMQQHHMEAPAGYACFPQQPAQMQHFAPAGNAQWCGQECRA